jgi:hypothetical protein
VNEAKTAGRLLREAGFTFDLAYTSVLKRAIRTLWLALDEMDMMWLPVKNDWRLNERHYGALQGLDKGETAAKFGDEQVLVWRRSYDTPPPPLEANDERTSFNDPRYAGLPTRADPADRMPEGHRGARDAGLGRGNRPGHPRRQEDPDLGPRQQPARRDQDARRYQRRRHRRPQHPERPARWCTSWTRT